MSGQVWADRHYSHLRHSAVRCLSQPHCMKLNGSLKMHKPANFSLKGPLQMHPLGRPTLSYVDQG